MKIKKIAIIPEYRPGYGDVNTVYDRHGLSPTITANASHGNAPLILIEVEDEDKNCEYPRMDDGESL